MTRPRPFRRRDGDDDDYRDEPTEPGEYSPGCRRVAEAVVFVLAAVLLVALVVFALRGLGVG